MAQPSLSEQVRRLEAELGVPLFVRAGRGLELTEAGHAAAPARRAHARRGRRRRIESVREVREMTGGTVAFGTFSSAHHYLTGGLVQDFRGRAPGRADPRRRPELAPRSPTPSATASSRPG